MSEMDAVRRTAITEQDFYQTLPCQVRALCNNLTINGSVLDAGSGKGVISNNLKKLWNNSTISTSEKNFKNPYSDERTFNFDEPEKIVDRGKFKMADFGDFLDVKHKFSAVVSNPPYSLKNEFIKHSLDIADTSIMLFPLQVLNYIEFCEKWLDNDLYYGRITLYPKVILNPAGTYVQGGNTGYGWFIWTKLKMKNAPPKGTKIEIFEDIRKYL